MRNHDARAVTLALCLLIAAAACGSPGRPVATTSSTPSPLVSPPTAAPTPSPTAQPSLTPKPSSSPVNCNAARGPIGALTGPIAVYYDATQNPDGSANPAKAGCATVTMLDGHGHKTTVVSTPQPRWRFACPNHQTGLMPGPAVSATADSVYWWDGTSLRWMDRIGGLFKTDFTVPSQVGVEFAVSPDNTRIVITEIDFGRSPLHRKSWIEDLGTHRHKTGLFDADLTGTNSTNAGWPWGWHDGNPVLYDFPLCVSLGGDQFFGRSNPRVVNAATGARVVGFPTCYAGTITFGGAFCLNLPGTRALDHFGWDGKRMAQWSLPSQTSSCDSDLAPLATRVLALCQPNIYSSPLPRDPSPRELKFGTGPALPSEIVKGGHTLHWLDDDLILDENGRLAGPEFIATVAVWSLKGQRQVAAPLDVPGVNVGRFPKVV